MLLNAFIIISYGILKCGFVGGCNHFFCIINFVYVLVKKTGGFSMEFYYQTTGCQQFDFQLIKNTFQINFNFLAIEPNRLIDTSAMKHHIKPLRPSALLYIFLKLLIPIYVAFILKKNIYSIWLQHCTCCSFLYNNRLIR